MKKLFALFLVALFLFNIAGYYFVYQYNQIILRNEMSRLIKAKYFNGSCKTIKIKDIVHAPGFKRLNNREFLYYGVLYDIISEKVSGNVTTICCINDKKEESLLAEFHHYLDLTIGQGDRAKAKHTQALLNNLITLALVETPMAQPMQYPTDIKYFNLNYPLSISLRHSLFHPPNFS